MKKKELSVFDKRELFEEEVTPLLEEIKTFCKVNKIPFFFSACVKNDNEGSEYIHDGNLCESNKIVLTDDKITDFIRILCGFKIREKNNMGYDFALPGEDIELNMDELGEMVI